MENIKNEISLRLVADNFGILMRNGTDMICPFVPPLQFRQVKQGSALIGGQPQEEIGVQKTACNTGCPLLNIKEGNNIEICCGNKVEYKISKIITVEEQMKPKKDNIINLKIDKNDKTVN